MKNSIIKVNHEFGQMMGSYIQRWTVFSIQLHLAVRMSFLSFPYQKSCPKVLKVTQKIAFMLEETDWGANTKLTSWTGTYTLQGLGKMFKVSIAYMYAGNFPPISIGWQMPMTRLVVITRSNPPNPYKMNKGTYYVILFKDQM